MPQPTSTAISATSTQDIVALVGRILLAYMYIPSGFGKLMGFAGTVGYITSAGLPLPEIAAAAAILVEIGCGIALLLGFQTRSAAVVLAIFTVVAGLFFHQYWAVPEAMKMGQMIHFNKNIAIAGGLLAFAAFGPGRLSVEKR